MQISKLQVLQPIEALFLSLNSISNYLPLQRSHIKCSLTTLGKSL